MVTLIFEDDTYRIEKYTGKDVYQLGIDWGNCLQKTETRKLYTKNIYTIRKYSVVHKKKKKFAICSFDFANGQHCMEGPFSKQLTIEDMHEVYTLEKDYIKESASYIANLAFFWKLFRFDNE